MEVYQRLITSLWLNHPDTAMRYARMAWREIRVSDRPAQQSVAVRLLGGVHLYLGHYDSALLCSREAYRLSLEVGDSTLISSALNNIGFTYFHFGRYPEALEFLLRALNMKLAVGQQYGLGQTFNNLGLVYYKLHDLEQARYYYTEALRVSEASNDYNIRLYAHNNLGFAYLVQQQYRQAEVHFRHALNASTHTENLNWTATTYNGLAQTHLGLGRLDSAQVYFERAMEIRQSIADRRGISETYYGYSKLALARGEYDKALALLRRSQSLARESFMRERRLENLGLFTEIYTGRRTYDSALFYQSRYQALRDSMFNLSQIRSLTDIRLKIQEEENQRRLAMKDDQLRAKNVQTNFLIGLMALSILCLLLVYILFRTQKRLSRGLRRKHEEVKRQHEEIEHQREALISANQELEIAKAVIEENNRNLSSYNVQLQNMVDTRNRELRMATQELKLVNQELDNFIYKSAHDIKGPLVRLIGVCHVALADVEDEKARDYFKMMYDTARHLNNIFESLRTINDINTIDTLTEVIPMRCFLEDAVAKFKGTSGFDQMQFFFEVESDLLIPSDPYFLEIICHNIVDNAIRFRRNDTASPHFLRIRAFRSDAYCQVCFIDNGIGVAEEQVSQLFRMFSMGALEHKTVGMGLYMVKQCLNRLGGYIKLASNADGYTEFQVGIPLIVTRSEYDDVLANPPLRQPRD